MTITATKMRWNGRLKQPKMEKTVKLYFGT